MGLSPRVRGNPSTTVIKLSFSGSIPARAGEPIHDRNQAELFGVYPRACGGTPLTPMRTEINRGLSPRVRGNRAYSCRTPYGKGSIPARAGEPFFPGFFGIVERVYPRACGGTTNVVFDRLLTRGLSPRVRGNPPARLRTLPTAGSIPARAGEPASPRKVRTVIRVYPRACGGTIYWARKASASAGLSPRVRGNRHNAGIEAVRRGSIPARAGEPISRRRD